MIVKIGWKYIYSLRCDCFVEKTKCSVYDLQRILKMLITNLTINSVLFLSPMLDFTCSESNKCINLYVICMYAWNNNSKNSLCLKHRI